MLASTVEICENAIVSNACVCVDSTSDGMSKIGFETVSLDGLVVGAGDMTTICCNDWWSWNWHGRACNG